MDFWSCTALVKLQPFSWPVSNRSETQKCLALCGNPGVILVTRGMQFVPSVVAIVAIPIGLLPIGFMKTWRVGRLSAAISSGATERLTIGAHFSMLHIRSKIAHTVPKRCSASTVGSLKFFLISSIRVMSSVAQFINAIKRLSSVLALRPCVPGSSCTSSQSRGTPQTAASSST